MSEAIERRRPTDFSQLEETATPDGEHVEVHGWISPFDIEAASSYFALVEEAACCVGCLPRDAGRRIEVFATVPVAVTGRQVRLRGRLHKLVDDAAGWRFQLRDAVLVAPPSAHEAAFHRRRVLTAATLACLAAASVPGCAVPGASDAGAATAGARAAIRDVATVDVHSHAGGVIGVRRVDGDARFEAVAAPMREGGMAAICLAIVSDSPTHRVTADRRIRPFRDPAPGELQQYGERSFARLHRLAQAQGLAVVRTAADLAQARGDRPAIVVSAEGGDFLEGRPERVDDAHDRWALRHLQLTHYRVNELGDIQTEPPVHGGLTTVGDDVVRRCNRLGVVVDVAHGTYDLVRRAAAVTTRPLVLSHTSLASRPGPYSRLVTAAHARVVADTGGVVGIWPPAGLFPDLAALAAGMARMVDAIGIDHVALGSDMRGLVGASTFDTYADLPRLAQALLDRGFQPAEVRKLLGGNYVRAFAASLAAPGPASSKADLSRSEVPT